MGTSQKGFSKNKSDFGGKARKLARTPRSNDSSSSKPADGEELSLDLVASDQPQVVFRDNTGVPSAADSTRSEPFPVFPWLSRDLPFQMEWKPHPLHIWLIWPISLLAGP